MLRCLIKIIMLNVQWGINNYSKKYGKEQMMRVIVWEQVLLVVPSSFHYRIILIWQIRLRLVINAHLVKLVV